MSVRLPRRLGADFTEAGRVRPTAMSVRINRRETSTTQMTLAGESARMGEWFEIYTARGSVGLFRVTEIEETPRRDAKYTLRHAIDTLSDEVWPEQTDYNGTVDGFLTAILSKQATVRWQLGTCADTSAYKRSGINYTRLSELLWALMDDRRGYRLSYDFSTTPWTLNFEAVPTSVGAEFRLSRNVETIRIKRSDEDMCNRLYLSVTDGSSTTVTIYNDEISQALYGVKVKTASIYTEDVPDAATWAAEFLQRRKSPTVQITVGGYELQRAGGVREPFDEMDVGKLCRVALPQVPEILAETIETVEYPDALGEPERVTVELNNHLDKFTESIASLKKAAGGGGGGGGAGLATAKELEHWAQIVTKQGEALDGTGITDFYQSGIVMDATTGLTIYNLAQGFQSNYAGIQVNHQAIESEVSTARSNESALSSRITQEANKIALVVENGAIKAASIVAAINGAGSSVAISADKIVLSGSTSISSIFAGNSTVTALSASTLQGATIQTTQGGTFTHDGYTWNARQLQLGTVAGLTAVRSLASGTGTLNLGHAHEMTVDSTGQVTCVNAVPVGDASATFNIADTAFYRSAVAAAETAGAATGWNNAAAAIVWPTQGTGNAIGITYPVSGGGTDTKAYQFTQESGWHGNYKKYIYWREDSAQGDAVARTEIDASGAYSAGETDGKTNGWDLAAGKVSFPSGGTGTATSISYPGTTFNTQTTRALRIRASGNWSGGYQYVYVDPDDGAGGWGSAIMRLTVNADSSATWNTPSGSVSPPSSSGSITVECVANGKTYRKSYSWNGSAWR